MKDQTIAVLIRMWVAGMICLFVAWSPLGGGEMEDDRFLYQMVFILTLFLFLSNLLVVNPVIRGMLKTRLDQKSYFGQPLWKRTWLHLVHFGKMLVITLLIWGSYIVINYVLGWVGIQETSGRPVLMLEPISFGILYGLFYIAIDLVTDKITSLRKPKEENR